MDPLLFTLHGISTKLDDKELDSLKFLCQDIGKKKLEGISSTNELFSCLIQMAKITPNNLDFLKKLLHTIKRLDLLQELEGYQDNGLCVDVPSGSLERSPLDKAFDVICDNVGKQWRMVIRRLGVSDVAVDNIVEANPLNMQEQKMQCLRYWKKKKGSNAQVSDLLQVLEACNMRLVAEKIKEELNID